AICEQGLRRTPRAVTGQATHPPVRLFWPALLTVVGVVILAALGTWQMLRMEEKQRFIARLESPAAGAPVAMPAAATWAGLDPAALDLTRVTASGSFVGDHFASVRTTIAAGERG